jgi:hypothetical protein
MPLDSRTEQPAYSTAIQAMPKVQPSDKADSTEQTFRQGPQLAYFGSQG